MKAIILAGGEGTRLRPLTCNIPKPMMPILGKPIIQYTIELLKNNGIEEIGITLQYLSDEITNYFGNGSKFGVDITYFIEEKPLGTAGSLINARKFIDSTFLVISGDSLTDINLLKALEYHRERKGIGTLILKEVGMPLEYGVVITDKNEKITQFLEKPGWEEVFSNKVNTGIYILEKEVFNYYIRSERFDFAKDLFPILLKSGKELYGYVSKEYWCDIGNIQQYEQCHFDILKKNVKVEIEAANYEKGIWIGENCEIHAGARIIPPAFIGKGTKVYNDTRIGPFAVLGKQNIISTGASIKRSIIFDNCYIGSNSEVRGAVLCKGVQLESKASVFEEAVIGNDTLIETKSTIKPGVKIWPNKLIEVSSVIKSNVIWGGISCRTLFSKRGIRGGINLDITPEFISKLGSAYGALLKQGDKIAVSCSNNQAAKVFKYSLITGLLSMGIQVYDLKVATTAMVRQAVTLLGVNGAIHIVVEGEDMTMINLLFMDSDGIDIDKSTQRKIENSFLREDFRRVKAEEFKELISFTNIREYYVNTIINKLNTSNIVDATLKIVFTTDNEIIKEILEEIFIEFQVNSIFHKDCENLKELSEKVVENQANLGIFISNEGDKAILVDEKGNIFSENLCKALRWFLVSEHFSLNTIVVPVTTSNLIDYIAESHEIKVIRTKTSQKIILDTYLKSERNLEKKNLVSAFITSLDAIELSILLLNFLAQNNKSLSELVYSFPSYSYSTRDIFCPWNMKGLVMRRLIEENSAKSIDLIEGVKLNYEDGWVLVIPDSDEALCRVYAESYSGEEMERLLKEVVKNIEKIVGDAFQN